MNRNLDSAGNQVHIIRLHGPWQAQVISRQGGPGGECSNLNKLRVPGDWSAWLGSEFRGVVQFERRFGMPTGLSPEQEIRLVIGEVDFLASITMNDALLGQHRLGTEPFCVPIRQHLQARNCLRIEIEMPEQAARGDRSKLAGGILGEVRLEIAQD